MPTPITAEAFAARGADPVTAAALAADFNRQAGIRSEAAPIEAPPVAPPRPSQPTAPAGMTAAQARQEIETIKQSRADGQISDTRWRREFEPRLLELGGVAQGLKEFRAGTSADRSTALAAIEGEQIQSAFEKSVDAAMEPARSPSDYLMPALPADNPDAARVDKELRTAMHAAGIPRDMGSALASEVEKTATVLSSGDEAKIGQYMADQEAALRRMFGSQYDARLELTRSFLRAQAAKSPVLRVMLDNKPEWFASWQVVRSLSQLAEAQSRKAGAK